MALRQKQARDVDRREAWDPHFCPAVRELLDHLARELADEYLRLTREAPTKKGERSR
jgi:hypothetical protein